MIFVGRAEVDPLVRYAFEFLQKRGKVCKELGVHDHPSGNDLLFFTAKNAKVERELYLYVGTAAITAAGIPIPEEFLGAGDHVALLPRSLSDFVSPPTRLHFENQLSSIEPEFNTHMEDRKRTEGELARAWHERDFIS